MALLLGSNGWKGWTRSLFWGLSKWAPFTSPPHISTISSPCAPAEVRRWNFLILGKENLREIWREFCGIFLTHNLKIKAQTFRSIFRKKIRNLKKLSCQIRSADVPPELYHSIAFYILSIQGILQEHAAAQDYTWPTSSPDMVMWFQAERSPMKQVVVYA